jgi:hypothetical protein
MLKNDFRILITPENFHKSYSIKSISIYNNYIGRQYRDILKILNNMFLVSLAISFLNSGIKILSNSGKIREYMIKNLVEKMKKYKYKNII